MKHIKTQKEYLKPYENKENIFKTWTLPYIYSRKHIKFQIIPTETYNISKNYNKTRKTYK